MGDWAVAGIDLIGALVSTTAIYQVYRHRRVSFFGLLLSVAAVGGVLSIVALNGVEDIHFIYPVLIVSYFLLAARLALMLSLAAIAVVTILLNDSLSIFYLMKIDVSILACSVFTYSFASLRNHQSEKLLRLSTRDGLTGVLNRRSLDERLQSFEQRAKRQHLGGVLVILDLDRFKQINDEQGHAVGDAVLIRIANTIQQRIRVTDDLYRYGGDEFVVLVPDTSLQHALGLAEDLRARVDATESMEGSGVSISLGVAAYEEGQSAEQWLLAADNALLTAKRSGRNQVFATTMET
tara:strand:- start:18534 stop:19415 length:882 start_codon:yes stop_codon:yes gene_type:complete